MTHRHAHPRLRLNPRATRGVAASRGVRGARAARTLVAAGALVTLSGCDDPREAWRSPTLDEPSPNVRVQAAELSPAHSLMTRTASELGDAGPAPSWALPRLTVREDQPLPADSLAGTTTAGWRAEARWIWPDVGGPPNVPALSHVAEREARKLAGLEMKLLFASSGRFTLELSGGGFPLAQGSQLRARSDLLGAALVWPSGTAYRPMPPGALRALLDERRLDVSQLVVGTVSTRPGNQRFGLNTATTLVETPWGRLELTQGELGPERGGGDPLCWLLMELIGAEPSAEICRPERLPLRAWYHWHTGGQLGFELTSLTAVRDLPVADVRVPPRGSNFETTRYPIAPPFSLPLESLAALRTTELAVPAAADAPQVGLVALQYADSLRALMIDGIPIAWIEPGRLQAVPDLKSGRYSIAWRDFLGQFTEEPVLRDVPGRIVLGSAPHVPAPTPAALP